MARVVEVLSWSTTPTGNRWRWEKIPGHERNEALDCRNYALAALRILNPDWDAIERSRREPQAAARPRRRTRRRSQAADEW